MENQHQFSPGMLDSTGVEILDAIKSGNDMTRKQYLYSMQRDSAKVDAEYNDLVNKAESEDQVTALFQMWWRSEWVDGESTRLSMLERWFGNVLYDQRVHGVKIPLFATSESAICELTDDSVGLKCIPSTAEVHNQDDFCKLPQFWAVEVGWDLNPETGAMEIYYVEHIDDIADVRSGEHLCGVAQKNTYHRDWIGNDGYQYRKTRCFHAAHYSSWKAGATPDGTKHAFYIHPKYMAGMKDGVITDGTGLAPLCWINHSSGVKKWKARNPFYSGSNDETLYWQLLMIQLKYAVKGNSGTIEGCTSYTPGYTCSGTETGVKRILLTKAQADNFIVGSSVEIGTHASGTSTDRNFGYNYDISGNAVITAKEEVTVNDVSLVALYVDTEDTFDTVESQTWIASIPYRSGWNDSVQGYDGSKIDPKGGKEPGLIQKCEFQIGAYNIVSNELWQWRSEEIAKEDGTTETTYFFECWKCDSKNAADSITSNYRKIAELQMPEGTTTADKWYYVEDLEMFDDEETNWPLKISSKAGSGTGVKAGFVCYAAASGVRAAWCCWHLLGGGPAGLAARPSDSSPFSAAWYGALGAPSSAA